MVQKLLATMLALVLAAFGNAVQAADSSAPGSLIWKFRVDGPIWGSLAHDAGVLYFGSDDRHLYALDAATQRLKWKFETAGAIRSRPAISDGMVFAASDDGFLYAIDRLTGRERWRFDMKSSDLRRRPPSPDSSYYDYLQSSPLVHDDQVFVGSLSGTLFVVDVATGALDWSVGTLDAVRSNPVISNGRLFFGSWDDHLYAVDLETRKIAWRVDTGGIIQSTPAIDRGRVIVGSRSAQLLAYDFETGAELWRRDYNGSWVESSAIVGDKLSYVGNSDALAVFAFDGADGKEAWSFKTGGWTWATPSLANGTLYIGSISAQPYYMEGITLQFGFHAIDAGTGKEKWKFMPDPAQGFVTGGVAGQALVIDDIVYFGALDGAIYALKT